MARPSITEIVTYILTFAPSAIAEEMTDREMVPSDDPVANATLIAMEIRSLDTFTALAVNLSEGRITGEDLTSAMSKVYPENNVGWRHGPHYLSYVRTGKITTRYALVGTKGKSTTAKPAKVSSNPCMSLDNATLRSMLKGVKPDSKLAAQINEAIAAKDKALAVAAK